MIHSLLRNQLNVHATVLGLTTLLFAAGLASVSADTVANWRLEEGAVGAPVPIEEDSEIGTDAVVDSSGNGNHLRAGGVDTAPLYVDEVSSDPVPQTGDPNNLALSFSSGRHLYTDGKALNEHQFTEWTIEASFKADRVDIWQILVGKDGGPLGEVPPPFFLKIQANTQHLELGLRDGAGTLVTVLSDAPLQAGEWYDVAATATEWELSLWLKGPGDSDYVLQGFFPADIVGAFYNTAEDFNRSWTIGQGMWAGQRADWFGGVIDEVRISGAALDSSEFLGVAGDDSGSIHTLAHWRFEEGEAGAFVPAPGSGGIDPIVDSSDSGNSMRVVSGTSAPVYSGDTAFNPVPQTGLANTRSLSFTPLSALATTGKPINSLAFEEWTVEVAFKANVTEAWQVILGKDGQPLLPGGGLHAAPPFMLKIVGPGTLAGRLELGMVDGGGDFRSILSLQALVAGEWYTVAATATASEMSFYLKGQGDTEYVLQGAVTINGAFTGPDNFPNPADFNRRWTAGRGMWGGGAADYFNGIIDEIRISDVALAPSAFLAAGDGAPPVDPSDLEVVPVIVERIEGQETVPYLGLETWAVADGTLQLQTSPDLLTWEDALFESEVIGTSGDDVDRLRLTSEIGMNEQAQHFLRLRID